MKTFLYLFLLISLLFSTEKTYSLNSDSLKYKRIESPYYELDSNLILIENDSLDFNGFFIFAFHKPTQNLDYFKEDSDRLVVESYWLNNLDNFNLTKKDYYWMSNYLLFYMYVMSDVGGHIYDSNEVTLQHLSLYNSEGYRKLKNLFLKYYNYDNKESYKEIFLKYGLYTKIFDDTSVVFLNYGDCDSIGYFVFKCSFASMVLKFKSYYMKEEVRDGKVKQNLGFIKVLLPISSINYFKPIEEKEFVQRGFKKAKWFPTVLYHQKK